MSIVTPTPATLDRRLGLGDAVFIGLGSMIGAGVFAAYAPAARAAGTGLLIGLAVAAVVAYCNATASAQLAATYPRAGGTYLYGREVLGDWWGYLAGWGFMVGKTASCAAMALTFAAYVAPDGWLRPVAATVVVVLALVNCAGVTRTALLTRVLALLVLVALVVAAVACFRGGSRSGLDGWSTPTHGLYGVLQSAGLLFFAFAGYARIATLGEEVREPQRVIPRAIVVALAVAVVVYAVVAVAVLSVLGGSGTADSAAPVADAVRATSASWVVGVVRVGAALASAGALLALIAGLGRTGLAMAREGDLPGWLDAIHPRFRVPHRAELTVAAVVVVLVLTTDLRGAIGFSSFGVLLYYFVANAAAYRQPVAARFPRWLQVLGAAGCLALVASLPWPSVLAGVLVFAIGLVLRLLARSIGWPPWTSS
jgi:basic amino acid/polyamine antiporter, APA family